MKIILEHVQKDIAAAFIYIPYGAGAAAVVLLSMILYDRKKYGRISFLIKNSLFIIYAVVVAYLTLFSRQSGLVDRVDLTFFSLLEESSDYMIQLIENVLLFLPAGILMPCIWKKQQSWKISLLTGAGLSLVIETVQRITGRGLFQIDDLITNMTGMMAGYGIFMFLKKIWKKLYKGENK